MPITVNQRRNGGYVILRSNTDEDLRLNTEGPEQGANATSGELVQSMAISEVSWSVSGSAEPGFIDVLRGSDTILTLSGSGHHDYQASGMRVETDSQLTANVSVSFNGDGVVVLKLHKVSGE